MDTTDEPSSAARLRRAMDALWPPYAPDAAATAEGEWDRGGPELRWRQDHVELVRAALRSWKGHPVTIRTHMDDELAGAPLPGSGNGKVLREQARALLWEIAHRARPSPVRLYRGSHLEPLGLQSWSESRKVATSWAKRNGGAVFVRPIGTTGLRVLDYTTSAFDDEREWVVDSGAPTSRGLGPDAARRATRGNPPDPARWLRGGCLAFAKALRPLLPGSSLVDVVEPEDDAAHVLLRPGLPHHVAVKWRGLLVDAEGAHSPEALLDAWNRRARENGVRVDLRLEPHSAARARECGLRAPREQVLAAGAAAEAVAARVAS